MAHYLVTWHESNGNDCTVYDTVVAAETEDAALNILSDALESALTENGTPFESGGNLVDCYFYCTDKCDEDCDGRGGIALRTVETYATEAEAIAACSFYHSLWTLPSTSEA